MAEFAIDYFDSLSTVPLLERHPQLRQPLYSSLLQVSTLTSTPNFPVPIPFLLAWGVIASCLLARYPSSFRSLTPLPQIVGSVSIACLLACYHFAVLLLLLPILSLQTFVDSSVAWPRHELVHALL